MSNNANISVTELSEERKLSEEKRALSYLEDLSTGVLEERTSHIESILINTTPKAVENDPTFGPAMEYQYQYILNSLLGIINNPENAQKSEVGTREIQRINAIKILTNIYPKILEQRPEDGQKIAQGICERIYEKKALKFEDFSRKDVKENRALLDFFRIAATVPLMQTDEITVNTFLALYNNYIKSEVPGCIEIVDTLRLYLRPEIKEKRPELFMCLSKKLTDSVPSLGTKDPNKGRLLDMKSWLYKDIMNNKNYVPREILNQMVDLKQTIFDQTIKRMNEEKDTHFSWLLLQIINENQRWSYEPLLIAQEKQFHIDALETVKNIIKAKPQYSNNKEFLRDCYQIMSNLLEQYVRYSNGEDDIWKEIANNRESFEEALELYLEGINDPEYAESIYNGIDKILNYRKVGSEQHPFHKAGIEFYAKHSGERLVQMNSINQSH